MADWLDHVQRFPASRNDVPEMKLDGPPATADQIDVALRRIPGRKSRR